MKFTCGAYCHSAMPCNMTLHCTLQFFTALHHIEMIMLELVNTPNLKCQRSM